MAAATSPRITDGEIISLANSRTCNAEVLRYIYDNREFLRTYAIKISLVKNPKVPLPTALKLLVTLQEKDIKELARDRNVPADRPGPGQGLHDEEGAGGHGADRREALMELEGGSGGAGRPAHPVRVQRAVWVSAATMTSRLLGLVRDQLFAVLFGANRISDAFVVAFRLPNLLRDLFAEGALSSAFVPTFADADRNRGPEAAHRLASAVIALLLLAVGAVVLAGELLARPLVRAVAPGLAEPALAALLVRVMLPFLLLVSLSAVAMGMLNAQLALHRPGAGAGPLQRRGDRLRARDLWLAGWPPERAVVGWAAGTVVGGTLQLALQLPSLRALGYRFRPRRRADLADPGLRRVFGLMGAAVVGLSATQVNIVVNTVFASHEVGANTWLQCAFRLMQLPLGVFGVAVATVAGVGVAQRAAARDLPGVKETLGSALRLRGLPQRPLGGRADGAGPAHRRARLPARPLRRGRHRGHRRRAGSATPWGSTPTPA